VRNRPRSSRSHQRGAKSSSQQAKSSEGKRCPERDNLEFHHDDPYGLGGDRSVVNVRLLCRQHHAYMAEKDYGREKMDQYRVREPSPSFELEKLRELDPARCLEIG